jgi:hypothetical protein
MAAPRPAGSRKRIRYAPTKRDTEKVRRAAARAGRYGLERMMLG